MRKLLSIMLFLISSSCFAITYDYCPSEIYCSKDDISSCHFIDGNKQFEKYMKGDGRITIGSYKISSISSYTGYENPQNAYMNCSYSLQEGKITRYISFMVYHYTAFIQNDDQWYLNGSNAGCSPKDYLQCPFVPFAS